ncbi:MAG: hypothetical protein UT30_C0001G0088 [Candidatus Uhrbacteria bacterium GW2011_GWF2_39_13]|uniref:Uncharacterized protein n=1 Tax=Candidatus Uhrbacteria bacterium GW2011_GWF2_39_13 TaxID=1618995 RepID=A0A0G0MM65_9BACT|nr:MAG: hypothetical protein UT30_C0001G0088 [Candidatus Uhrbacteria bacterium GW2011_GWF2_39_13]HAU66415.1 hypothetical protein [Candidatus Uhrbacteria bacterium]
MNPIKLTAANNWQELDQLEKNGVLPGELARHLKALVGCHLKHMVHPTVSDEILRLAKRHVKEGILITDEKRCFEQLYDIVLFQGDEQTRPFFHLIAKYPQGRFRYLDEI